MNKIIEINDSNYESVIKNNPNLLIDFYAPWCGPCKMISPILEEISSDDSIKTIIAKVNVDDSPIFSSKMKIRTLPSVYYFKNSNPIEKLQILTKGNILNFIKQHE
jgi:thioredoxin 1